MTRRELPAALGLVLPILAHGAEALDTPAKNRILFLVAEGVNRHEVNVPYDVGRAVGYEFDLAGPALGVVTSGKDGAPTIRVDRLLEEVTDVTRYAGLIIPGGGSPGNLEKHPASLEICRKFFSAKVPVLAICHGPRLLIRAGLMKDRVGTSLTRVADEMAEAWLNGEYGKYLDRPVVLDGALLTSPHYAYAADYLRAMLDLFERHGGIPLARRPARVGVVTAGTRFPPHAKWAMKDVPGIVWTDVSLLETPAAIAAFVEAVDAFPAGTSSLFVLPGKDLGAVIQDDSFVRLAAKMRALGAPIVGVNAAFETLKGAGVSCVQETAAEETYGAYVRLIVKRAQQAGHTPSAAAEPSYTATVSLAEKFNDRLFAALQACLAYRGETVAVTGSRTGWMMGQEGLPACLVAVSQHQRGGVRHEFAVSSEGIAVGKTDGDVGSAVASFARGALADADASPTYSAVLALREGFDGHAYAALRAFLAATGRKTAVVGPRAGALRGMNGVEVKIACTYDDPPKLEPASWVVAPGGHWPEKDPNARQAVQPAWIDQQAERDARRLQWLVDAHKAGAVLVVVGFDGWRLARDATYKGVAFAGSAQAGSKFGGLPGMLAKERALKSADRLYSAQGPDALGDLLRLMESDGVIDLRHARGEKKK
jgi:protease I